jgi:hypothetical protein
MYRRTPFRAGRLAVSTSPPFRKLPQSGPEAAGAAIIGRTGSGGAPTIIFGRLK